MWVAIKIKGNTNFIEPGLGGKNNSDLTAPTYTFKNIYMILPSGFSSVQDKIQASEIGTWTPRDFQSLPWQFLLPLCAPGPLRTGPVHIPSLPGRLPHSSYLTGSR